MFIRTALAVAAAAVASVTVSQQVASAAPAASPYTFTIRTSTPSVTLGSAAKFSGTVRPSASGSALSVQKKSGTTWKAVKSFRSGAGTYAVSLLPSTPGVSYYRVCKPAAGAYRATCSAAVAIGVYKWHYLTDLDAVDYAGIYADPVAINGTTYTRGFYDDEPGPNPSYREYNLNRKCRTLSAVYGLSDETHSGSQAQVGVLGDGNTLFEQTFGLGQAVKQNLAVGNVLRIRFEATGVSVGNGYYGIGAVGAPRVLCRF